MFSDSPKGQTHYQGDGCKDEHGKPIMNKRNPEEILKEEADTCMAVLQGFVLGRYGQVVVSQETTDEFCLIIRQAIVDTMRWAVEEAKSEHFISPKEYVDNLLSLADQIEKGTL